ncbi:MAG: AmmeMemoRadiSam system protein B [Candidatus Peribacteraceae bacterium]
MIRRSFIAASLVLLAGCGRADAFVTIPDAYDSPQQFLSGIYRADRSVTPSAGYRIRAAIVPHHLTASETIAAGIRMLSKQKISRIVLLSPDHFAACPTLLCTMRGSFRTQLGTVETDSVIPDSPLVTSSPSLFRKEHGITGVLPFLAHYEPGVKIVPLVLSTSKPWRDALPVLEPLLTGDTVLVVSSDFSHYLPLEEADVSDEATAKTLFAKDFDGIARLRIPAQSDCPGCLWLLANVADRGDFFNPSVIRHTNSARILNEPDVKETTSHFAMVFYENAKLSGTDAAFAGDVTVTRAEGKVPKVPVSLRAFWSGSGARVVNLEGPIGEGCVPSDNPFIFCNERSTWRGLKEVATQWITLNNHMFDRGVAGLDATVRMISEDGEVPLSFDPVEAGDLRLFAFTPILNPAEDRLEIAGKRARQKVLDALRASKDDKLRVVYVHGGTEYSALTTADEDALYHSFIDAGADAVIAVHSHVPGDMEIYAGKPIFRGLGNFLFDQFAETATKTAKVVRLRETPSGSVLFETSVSP